MNTKEKYVMGEHIHLVEEKCIQVIERELDSFFEIRLNFIYLICGLYINGSVKHSDDILKYLNLFNYELETFIETVVYKVSNILNHNLSQHTIYFNNYNMKNNYMYYVENNIKKFIETEKLLSLCEMVLDISLSKMLGTCCQSTVLNYAFNTLNLPEKILDTNSLKHQRLVHSSTVFEQLKGYILNLKCDLRNDLVKWMFLLVNSIY
ncbi:hypothetical protein [Clostridium sp.]|uniref:hypothetical protein n=1 Tax=Clostridium sp. TaxID=1506 RepID=UPI00284358A1|nr:hypothetical protein [Clostridium sp.]MDR3597412.1 hypothetical protein [Clostridium sp.]